MGGGREEGGMNSKRKRKGESEIEKKTREKEKDRGKVMYCCPEVVYAILDKNKIVSK